MLTVIKGLFLMKKNNAVGVCPVSIIADSPDI